MHALAAGQHREADEPDVGEMLLDVRRRLLDRVEPQPLVGIEVEHQPVGLLQRIDRRTPAVKLDRPHLHARDQTVRILDIEIGLGRSVLLANVDVMDEFPEAARVVLLEEAFLAAPLRAADEADRAVGGPGQHDRRHLGVIGCQIPLGHLAVGEDQPVRARYLDVNVGGCGRGGRGFGHDILRRLVSTQAQIARVAQHAIGREFGEGDFGDELGRHP